MEIKEPTPGCCKIKISIATLAELPLLHKEVAKYLESGWVSENRIMSDGDSWYEILVKE